MRLDVESVSAAAETGGTDFGTLAITSVIALAVGVASTVLVPWVTALITKGLEREAQERSDRRVAALELVQTAHAVASMYSTHAKARNVEEQQKILAPFETAKAKVLLMTTHGVDELADYLSSLAADMWRATYGNGNDLPSIPFVAAKWAKRGRFVPVAKAGAEGS